MLNMNLQPLLKNEKNRYENNIIVVLNCTIYEKE